MTSNHDAPLDVKNSLEKKGFADNKECIIFHHPGPLDTEGNSGSKVRPLQLLDAFKAAGYEVEPVIGYANERKHSIKRLLGDLKDGRSFSFVYSESRSIPTLLTEKHHLPVHPLLDKEFLKKAHQAGIPTGLFYRDIYWRFDVYKSMLARPYRMLTIPLYWYDWHWYQSAIHHLFLPSSSMARWLPTQWAADRLSALPPGTQPTQDQPDGPKPPKGAGLRLFYVGGITPPLYDLSPLFRIAERIPEIIVTICCRKAEWNAVKNFYGSRKNIQIIHLSGDQLVEQYRNADVIPILREPHEYLDFAAPVKVFEAFSHGVPILCFSGNEAGRIVSEESAGWTVDSIEEAHLLLQRLTGSPGEVQKRAKAARAAAEKHSWDSRVKEIAHQLGKYAQTNPGQSIK